ncbi:MAG: hypothetical protein NC188_06575, partial [Corallococcus sp.]|nr:hypothetical protein [Corallococcus sp.]
MILHSLEATNTSTNEKQTFTFDTAVGGKKVVTSKGGKLKKYLEYCFVDTEDVSENVVVNFSIGDDKFRWTKNHASDGTVRQTLRQSNENGKLQTVATGKNVRPYVEEQLGESLDELMANDFVSDRAVSGFHGDVSLFHEIKVLLDISDNIKQTNEEIRQRGQKAKNKLVKLAQDGAANVTEQQVEEVSVRLGEVHDKIVKLN